MMRKCLYTYSYTMALVLYISLPNNYIMSMNSHWQTFSIGEPFSGWETQDKRPPLEGDNIEHNFHYLTPEKKIIWYHIFAYDKAQYWFEKGFEQKTCMQVSTRGGDYPKNLAHTYNERFAKYGHCSYATKYYDVIAGFTNGTVLIEIYEDEYSDNYRPGMHPKHESYSFNRGEALYNIPVSAGASDRKGSRGGYPDNQCMLIAYTNKTLLLINRTTRKRTLFDNATPEPVTHIIHGPIPNTWILGGGTFCTIARFSYKMNNELKLHYHRRSLDSTITGLRNDGINITVYTTNGSYLLVPYAWDTYKLVTLGWYTPEQEVCILRLIAAKEAHKQVEILPHENVHFDALPEQLKLLLLDPTYNQIPLNRALKP